MPNRTANSARSLDQEQLRALEQSFRSWMDASRRPNDKLSRRRIWLIFLLLRATGARLGEVLGLDVGRDLDLGRGVVRLGCLGEDVSLGGCGREVPLPADVRAAFAEALADPELGAAPEALLRMDPGHVRRKFYERAEAAGLPKALACPSVLRRSRAQEFLRSDVPLPVVQQLLGQSSADLTAAFVNFSGEDVQRITEHFLRREERKTSARNRFHGQITAVRRCGVLAEVEMLTLGGFVVETVVTGGSVDSLGIAPGVLATAEIKAPWVQLTSGREEPRTTAANRFPAIVRQVLMGPDPAVDVAAEVVSELADGTRLCSVITAQSVRRLRLKPGDLVWASFGAFSVILNFD